MIEAMLRAGLPGPRDETREPPSPLILPRSPTSLSLPLFFFSPRSTKLFVSTRSGAHGALPCRDVSVPDASRRQRERVQLAPSESGDDATLKPCFSSPIHTDIF